jgi:hypothetical protein
MIELIVTDSDEPQPEEIQARVTVCGQIDVESVLRTRNDICYGTHYLLRGDGVDMTAICTTEGYLRPGEAGRFLLYRGGKLIDEHATRDDVIRIFGSALK